ncbi:hypothetical protein BKA93DRAFT_779033 [Sparassis latifolia]
MYPSWDTFTRVLDKPAAYNFNEGDGCSEGGTIWVDRSITSHQQDARVTRTRLPSTDMLRIIRISDSPPDTDILRNEG